MSQLSIRLFGYPQFSIDGVALKVERRKTLALAAYLAVETGLSGSSALGRPGRREDAPRFGREALAALFWPDAEPERSSSYLRQALWDFSRAAGEDWLLNDRQSIGFNPDAAIWVDVNAFRALYGRENPGLNPRTVSAEALRQLAGLFQEDFLSGFSLADSPAFDEWQTLHTETLRLQLSLVLEELSDRLSAEGRYEEAIQFALRWLALDPLDESSQRALIRLYEDNGQSAAALNQYEACARLLKNELGIDPSAETASLYQRILHKKPPPAVPRPEPPGESRPPAAALPADQRPRGTVTFLFTDIEGSTALWERHPQAMKAAFKRQEAILRQAMAGHHGLVYKMIGDAFQVAFSTAADALDAALAAQRGLQAEPWGETGRIKVRMALHTGVAEERADDYVGPTLNRVARMLSAGYGDQILLNQPAYEQLRENRAEAVEFIDLGEKLLKDLLLPEHMYQVKAPGLPLHFPPLKTLEAVSSHLPPQTTAFIGRAAELAEIEAMLGAPDCRLVTLVGIGGSGKTRLAIQAAAQSRAFAQNVYFAALEGVSTSSGLLAAIADACNLARKSALGEEGGATGTHAQLAEHLARRTALLVLDNFEQLIPHVLVLADLLAAAPLVKLLVTSRERLNLEGEWVLQVLGLAYPGKGEVENIAQYPAAVLFARTMERTSGQAPAEDDLPAIARICQLLEGVPLGIEMAASWLKVLTCQEVVEELEKNLDFLSASWRGLPERQRTIRAVFEYSWSLLNAQEKQAFSGLSLFRGGFTREAAMAVGGISLSGLSLLLDKSLIRRQSSGRYEIHPLLSQYSAEKLSAQPERLRQLQRMFCAFYCEWLARMDGKMRGRGQREALALLRAESKNLVAAWQWLVEQRDEERLLQFLPGYLLFYEYHNRYAEFDELSRLLGEMMSWLAQASGEKEEHWPSSPHAGLLALVIAGLRHFSVPFRSRETIYDFTHKSLHIALALPDSYLKAIILLLTATGPTDNGVEDVTRVCQLCIDIFTRFQDSWGVAMATLIRGDTLLFNSHQPAAAYADYQSALKVFKELGNEWGQGKCLFGTAMVRRAEEREEEAYGLAAQSAELFEKLGSQASYLFAQMILAEIAEQRGWVVEALQHCERLCDFFQQNGDLNNMERYQGKAAGLREMLKNLKPLPLAAGREMC